MGRATKMRSSHKNKSVCSCWSWKKKNKGGAKQAGVQATKPKGTQVKSLSASASGPSDKDPQKMSEKSL